MCWVAVMSSEHGQSAHFGHGGLRELTRKFDPRQANLRIGYSVFLSMGESAELE